MQSLKACQIGLHWLCSTENEESKIRGTTECEGTERVLQNASIWWHSPMFLTWNHKVELSSCFKYPWQPDDGKGVMKLNRFVTTVSDPVQQLHVFRGHWNTSYNAVYLHFNEHKQAVVFFWLTYRDSNIRISLITVCVDRSERGFNEPQQEVGWLERHR